MKCLIKHLLSLLLLTLLSIEAQAKEKVLIISSYNPEISSISRVLNDFIDENIGRGDRYEISVESINSLSYQDAKEWSYSLSKIMQKYDKEHVPDAIVVLGQEAWSAYLSQTDSRIKEIPVFCAMVSRNVILLPNDSVDLENWIPESMFVSDFKDFNIKGGGIGLSICQAVAERLSGSVGLDTDYKDGSRFFFKFPID